MTNAALLAFAAAACSAALALAAGTRARRSLSRWSFTAGMALLALESLCIGLALSAATPADTRSWQEWRFATWSLLPVAWLVFGASYARGESRRGLLSPLRIALLAGAAALAWLLFHPATFGGAPSAAERTALRLGWFGITLGAFGLLGAIITVLHLERTFRAAVGTMRWRIKFMLLGVGALFIARIYTGTQILVFHGIDSALDAINCGALLAATPLMVRSFFRPGHFDLAVYPSEAVLRNSVTVLVAGTYLVLTGFLAQLVSRLGGDQAFALKTFLILLALVALAVGLQSDHARLHLRRFVSRHFQRPLHDYRTVWQKFTEATTAHIDAPALSRAVTGVIADVFQCLSVSLWLLNDRRDALVLAASTSSASGSATGSLHRLALHAPEIAAHFHRQPAPLEIELSPAPWAAALRDVHPAVFPHGGRRVCAPLVSRGELLGLVLVGDRVGAVPFGVQDLEMLQCIANHSAASLMNCQFARRLAESRELEAFQAMAAFFVHDLKNAASTLNLMLQNLPVHFDNPAFRADALRGIGKTVGRIDRLIGRLSALRHELKIQLADTDLNEVVEHVLAGLPSAGHAGVARHLAPLPRIPLDREQFDKVITNLVLNATEAVTPPGRVQVTTGCENGWVVLTVSDNGCGMSDEFMQQSLFRPFQTTKPSGLGIGLFHSRTIVEAHGGRITVASRPGEGTTFRVLLKAPPAALRPAASSPAAGRTALAGQPAQLSV